MYTHMHKNILCLHTSVCTHEHQNDLAHKITSLIFILIAKMKGKKSGVQDAKAASASASPKLKLQKNVNRTPIREKPVSAAKGGMIESFQTAVVDIVISIVSKNGAGAYIRPHIDAFREGNEACSEWCIDGIMPRRDIGNEPMKSSPTQPYQWDCIVTLRDSQNFETPDFVGRKLAASFSSFSTSAYEKRLFQYKGDISEDPPLSLNNYLLDRDCIVYLKKIYFGVSKDEIMEDEETLSDFFGSPDEGRRILSALTNFEWEGEWYG